MKTKTKDVCSACITECSISTNCPKGGDSGNGGRTIFELKDTGGTDLSVGFDDGDGDLIEFRNVKAVRIILGGDCEAENLCRLLRWAANELENMIEENTAAEYDREFNTEDPFSPTVD